MSSDKVITVVLYNGHRFVPRSLSTNVAKLFGATPLEMNHFKQFSTTRRPRKGMDEVLRFTDQKHIVIMCRGHLYALNALQSNGTTISFIPTNLALLKHILCNPPCLLN